ncbi:MAG: HEPN domain-containing protein [Candidatus Geothermarchaeales archaeon]
MNDIRRRADEAIKSAEREFKNGSRSLKSGDYAGALKYFQECTEYMVKAVLIAYGIDYPKMHGVGRFLIQIEEKFPEWFRGEVEAIAEVTDSLARGRPRFRYPYEYPLEEHEEAAKKVYPKVREALKNCKRLTEEISERKGT